MSKIVGGYLDGKYITLGVLPSFVFVNRNLLPFSGNTRMDLDRVHHPGQNLIKASFKFVSKLWE